MEQDPKDIANFENILKKNAEKSRVSLYSNSKPLNTSNYKPNDVISNVTLQLKAIQTADRVKSVKNSIGKLSRYKSNFVPVNKLPGSEEVPSTSKFETQYVSNTQLVDLIRNAEHMDNPRGMTQEFETSFTHTYMDKEKLSVPDLPETRHFEPYLDSNMVENTDTCLNNAIIKGKDTNKQLNVVDKELDTLRFDRNKVEIAKNTDKQSPVDVFDVNINVTQDNELNISDVKCQNDFENDSDSVIVFNSIDSGIKENSQRSTSPILNLKTKQANPLVYSLEEFERFESLAMPLISEHEDFTTAKHLINSQIFGKELVIVDDAEFIANEPLSQIIEIKNAKPKPLSGLHKVDILKAEYSNNSCVTQCESDPIQTVNKIDNPITQESLNFDNEQKITDSDIETKEKQPKTDLIAEVPKIENPKHTAIDYHDDEILFSSDEECLQDLPFTCALETSFYNMSAVLDKTMFVAFHTASNKSIQVHTDSFHKAKSILDDFDEKGLSITEMVKIQEKGTEKGEMDPIINVTDANFNQQEDIAEAHIDIIDTDSNVEGIENNLAQQTPQLAKIDFITGPLKSKSQQDSVSDNTSFQGFKTASNKIIKLSEQALNRCRKVFQDVDVIEDVHFEPKCEEDKVDNDISKPANFRKISSDLTSNNDGKESTNTETDNFINDKINDDILLQEFENVEMSLEDNFINSNRKTHVENNNVITIETSEKNIDEKDLCVFFDEAHKSRLEKETNNNKTNVPENIPQFVGFKTANNKGITISKEALAKTKSIFEDIDCLNIDGNKNNKTLPNNIDVKNNLDVRLKPVVNLNALICEDVIHESKNIDKQTKTSTETNNNYSLKTNISKKAVAESNAVLGNNDLSDNVSSVSLNTDHNQMNKVIFKGFSTASNKPVSISKAALAKSKKLFQDIDLNEDVFPEDKNSKVTKFQGFSTASNKPVTVSDTALSETKKLFHDIENVNVNETKFCGFKTASHKTVNISEEALAKSKKILNDIANVSCNENLTLPLENKAQIGTGTFQGFTTASNKPVQISKEALLKSKKLFEGIDMNDFNGNSDLCTGDKGEIDSSRSFKGFNKASNIPVQISEDALEQSKNIFHSKDLDDKQKPTLAPSDKVQSFQGFSTASNKPVQISKEALAKSKRILQEIDFTDNKSLNIPSRIDAFETFSNKDVFINKDALAETKKMLRDKDTALPEMEHFKGFQKANNKKVTISDTVVVKSRQAFQDFNLTRSDKNTIDTGQNTNKHDTNINTIQEINEQELKKLTTNVKEIETIIDTQVLKDFDATLHTEDFQTPKRNKRSGSPILSCPRAKKRKFETPYLNTKAKPQILNEPKIEKSDIIDDNYKKNKIYTLKDLFEIEKDRNTNSKTTALGFDIENLLNITFSGAKNEINNAVVTIGEIKELFLQSVNPKLIPENWMDNHLKLIIWKLLSYEIKFPTSLPNVCSVKNVLRQLKYRYDKELYEAKRPALRLILEKDDIPSRPMVLCVVGVFMDGVQVDSPSKPENLELLISDGWYCLKCTVDKMLARLVCEGRLKVGDKIITCGAELVNCKGVSPWEDTSSVRLKIFGNSTRKARWDIRLGYQNMAAMTVPLSTVKLDGGKVVKLTVYVTRVYPALYVEKFEDGSTVTRSERLEHLHQMKHEAEKQVLLEKIYEEVEKEFNDQDSQDSDSPEWSNKRKWYETGSQIAKMMKGSKDPMEFKHTLTPSQAVLLNEYTNSRRERVLQDLQSKVRERVEASGVHVNRNVVTVVKTRVVGVRGGSTTRDVRSPDDAFLVLHHYEPNNDEHGGLSLLISMLSIWKPTDAVQEILKEGTWIDVINVIPTAFRYSEIQISAGRQSVFSRSKSNYTDKNNIYTKSLNRIVYSIKDLVKNPSTEYNEIDTFGMVFQIDPSTEEFESKNHSFQNVYLTDSDKNLLCVNFWGGLKKFGFRNILDTGQIVVCVNLQKRVGNTRKSIPQYRATEFSHFTKTPKNDVTRNLIRDFETTFISVNKIKFCEDCNVLKNYFSTNRYINNENISPYRFNNSDYCLNNKVFIETPVASKKDEFTLTGLDFESTFQQSEEQLSPKTLQRKKKVNERITKLKMYGEPPPLSPIHIINKSKNACNSYKSPLISKSDVPNSVTSAQKSSDTSVSAIESIDCSPVISMNKTYVKRSNVNPTKLNFSHNLSKGNDSLDEI